MIIRTIAALTVLAAGTARAEGVELYALDMLDNTQAGYCLDISGGQGARADPANGLQGHTLGRLWADAEEEVVVPVFDRDMEVSRGSACAVPRAVRTIVTGGNWLLLGGAPWSALAGRFDLIAWFDVPEAELAARLTRPC